MAPANVPANVIELPDRLDARALPGLIENLLSARGAPIEIVAQQVGFVGAAALQVLIMAQRQWAKDGQDFQITTPSDAFDQGLCDLGMTCERLTKGEYQ